MAGFLSPLELEYVNGRQWRITAEFDYYLGAPDGPEAVKIPTGFVTDFASIPQLFWNILPPTGSYGKAAVIHDWMYQKRTVKSKTLGMRLVTRREADASLYEGMTVLGVGWLTRWVIYVGVRAGGWWAWNHYRQTDFAPYPR